MKFLFAVLVVPAALGVVLLSETRQYDTCKRLSGGESPSDIFLAVMSDLGVTHPNRGEICASLDRTNPSLVVVKCEKPNEDEEDLRNEIERVRALAHLPWAVHMIEEFTRPRGNSSDRCYSMEILGRNLREIRERSHTEFDLATLASIGLQMINVLDELHNRYRLYHTDVHAANWLVRVDDPSQLSLIDYGYMVPISGAEDAIKELQEMIITLRWYTDLRDEWYVPKKIIRKFGHIDVDTLCAAVPEELKRIVDHVLRLTPETFNPVTEYETIRGMFMAAGATTGIEWNDARHLAQVTRRPPAVGARRAVVAPTTTTPPSTSTAQEEDLDVVLDVLQGLGLFG